jgi:hypothetical protein
MDRKLALAIGRERALARIAATQRSPVNVERLVAAANRRAKGRSTTLDHSDVEAKPQVVRRRSRPL